MDGDTYHQVLKDHLMGFYKHQNCECFMHDGAVPHRKNSVTQLVAENNIEALEWPGNSPDLNPMENVWHIMKNKVAETQSHNISEHTKNIHYILNGGLFQPYLGLQPH